MRSLKRDGMPFAGGGASRYESLQAADFSSIVRGESQRVTKRVPMVQVADLCAVSYGARRIRPPDNRTPSRS